MNQTLTTVPAAPSRRGFRAGAWASMPVLLAVAPFGFIFGALATEAGLDPLEAMAMTAIVTAGAAQLAALQLMVDQAPALIAVLTGAVVNLRMAMYSASLAVHWREVSMLWRVPAAYFLNDQAYALSMRRYLARPDEPLADKVGFYFGVGVTTVGFWFGGSLTGVMAGRLVPPEWGLGFAVPVTFLAVVAPLLRGTANIVAAVAASAVAVACSGLPYGLGLVLGGAAGIAAGMTTGRLARSSAGRRA